MWAPVARLPVNTCDLGKSLGLCLSHRKATTCCEMVSRLRQESKNRISEDGSSHTLRTPRQLTAQTSLTCSEDPCFLRVTTTLYDVHPSSPRWKETRAQRPNDVR